MSALQRNCQDTSCAITTPNKQISWQHQHTNIWIIQSVLNKQSQILAKAHNSSKSRLCYLCRQTNMLVNEKKIHVWQQSTIISRLSGQAPLCWHTLNQSDIAIVIQTFASTLPISATIWLLMQPRIRLSVCTGFSPSLPVSQKRLSQLKTLHIDEVLNLSLWFLYCFIYNWSLMSKSNMRHCCTLLLRCLSLSFNLAIASAMRCWWCTWFE